MAKGQNALHSKVNKKATRGNASARRRRGKATKPKVRYSKRRVASTAIRGERSPRAAARNSAHKNEVPANSHIDATLPGTQAPEVIGAAARLESSPKTIFHIGRILRVVPRADGSSANQRTEAPKEFRGSYRVPLPSGMFQLQNQLVKEQAELFAVSIYAPFLNQIRHSSEQVAAAL